MYNKLFINNNIKKLVYIACIIWILCATFLIIRNWSDVANFALSDTDDLMRYHQYSEWLKNGNWYLLPDPQFNPQDGVIMHWSRVVDIPLAGVALLASIFTDWNTAFTISNVITPLLYLLIFLLIISLISYRLFGLETAKIAMLFPLLAPISYRFLPGALDHHNLQFILLISFCIFSIAKNKQNQNGQPFFIAISIVLSLWIGLENIYSFVAILMLFVLYGLLNNLYYLELAKKICLHSSILSFAVLILNRPANELFIPQYDALSFPFLLCFIAGSILCTLLIKFSIHFTNKIKKIAFLCVTGIALVLPIIIIYPNLIKGGYADYPIFLKDNWLSFVSEARPLTVTISQDIGDIGYFIAILPAILSPLFLSDKKELNYWIIYIALITNLLLAIFWQVRMFYTAMSVAIPLQAYTCYSLREKCSLPITKTIILFLSIPTFLLISTKIIINFNDENESKEIYDEKYNNSYYATEKLLNKNNLENKIILPPIDLGAAVIATTSNASISAPYHRNIRGNSDTMRFYTSVNTDDAEKYLIKNNVDYILIEKNFANVLADKYKGKEIMAQKLIDKKDIPDYLEFIDANENTNIILYKFIKPELK
ncbi:hypothetical protein [Aggregatibacter actinomycetemcomitans]|uniref:hypothetical protein n=1 Tax=Aggregatibacter actinomycetemcomitans TaxID=714 RepID=UPI001E6102BA|nr:hypothetical protein [Aggregatibacter actinomycetemcomitans]